MTVREFIESESSSQREKETALYLAANYLEHQVKDNTSDNNNSACVVACFGTEGNQ